MCRSSGALIPLASRVWIHNSAVLLLRCIPLKFNADLCLIYRGGERYEGAAYQTAP